MSYKCHAQGRNTLPLNIGAFWVPECQIILANLLQNLQTLGSKISTDEIRTGMSFWNVFLECLSGMSLLSSPTGKLRLKHT